MADKITNFEDYKKRDNTEEIDIQIEDPYHFFDEEEREEYFKERQKEIHDKEIRNEEAHNDERPDREDAYEEDDYVEEDDAEDAPEGGFPIEMFVRISSIITGIVILAFLAMVFKVKIYDRYLAKDPDQMATVVQAIPAGFTETNDTVTVTAESLNLRSVPSAESSETVIASVSKGTSLKRIAVNSEGTWALVEYNNSQLYASMKYLSAP